MKTDLESVLSMVAAISTPPRELTLFSVGGRGYYENPASDLLRFFLQPNEEHGLGDLFLSSFLECMGKDRLSLALSPVKVDREVRTTDLARIDLELVGTDWCLITENKVNHGQNNPFPS